MEEQNMVEATYEEVVNEVAIKEEAQLPIAKEIMNMDKLMEMGKMLSKSTIVPINYQNRPENCFVALDVASRTGMSVLTVMQNMYVIQGKPSWSGQAIASMIRSNPNFRNVELNYVGKENTDTWGAYVTAENARNGKVLKGGTVTIGIAKREGWYAKSGSKWQTTPELMLAYRSYTWFGRVYCPETLAGLLSADEAEDIKQQERAEVINPYERK